MSKEEMKPCPFCGTEPFHEDPDFVHPDGRPLVNGRQVWIANCCDNWGGCGASVYGWSRDDAIKAWNRRPEDACI